MVHSWGWKALKVTPFFVNFWKIAVNIGEFFSAVGGLYVCYENMPSDSSKKKFGEVHLSM